MALVRKHSKALAALILMINRDDLKKELYTALDEIEAKHISIFEKREPQLPEDKHDRLRHHVSLYLDAHNRLYPIFNKDESTLPDRIIKEVEAVLLKIFPQKS